MRSNAARPGWTLVTIVWLPLQAILSDRIAHDADSPDLRLEEIAGLHELGRRAREAHALGGAGREDVARFQRRAGGEIGDEARHLEIHVAGVGLLLHRPIDAADHVEVRGIDLLRRHDPRSHRAAAVEALALVPLAAMTALQVAPRDVVHDRVAPHVLHGVFLRDVLAAGSDD